MKTIFQTLRLRIRRLEKEDSSLFCEMMSDPKVMNPIPANILSQSESEIKLSELMAADKNHDTRAWRVWCITEKGKKALIGICGFLKNDEGDEEIAYRFRSEYWGIGLGTEIAEGLIEYGFTTLKAKKITADVNIENVKSEKILKKFMSPVKEFYNKKDKCTDRRYEVLRSNWKLAKNSI